MNKTPKIVVTNNQYFTKQQKERLDSLGEVTYYDSLPNGAKEYLERVKNADIICSGTTGLKDAYPKLKNVFISIGFVNFAFLDLKVLKKNNVSLSNAPGSNRHAVSEWIMCMVVLMMRDLYPTIKRKETFRKNAELPPVTAGLAGKNITILGKGNIGKRVGELANAFGMYVKYFKRGGDLYSSVKDADIVVNTLSANPDTIGLLNKKFFNSMKKGSYFVTVARDEIVDTDAMLKALDSGRLERAASDCGSILAGETREPLYQKLVKHQKVLVTPHIAYNSEMSVEMGAEILIDNVEAWIKGDPQNVVV